MKAQNIFLDENTGGKGRYFKARFLQPGLVKYSFGVCLLEKDVIDKFIFDFVGCPVIIGHNNVTNENAKDLSVGNICHIWYDQLDGWYWGDGIIDNQEALNKIEEGYSVSCQYEITEYSNNTTEALHNGNPYDKVILNGKPEHLAIVDKPRYENAIIAVNALDSTEENKQESDTESVKDSIAKAINELKELKMFDKLFNKKENQMNKDEMKSLFMECIQDVLKAQNEEDKKDEDKEEDKKEDKDLEKEAENKCKNEVVDKREIIRQIMAIAGKKEDDEDVKTIAKLAEKLAYDESEAKTADNKCKNEDEEEDEKEAENKKAKNSIEELKSLITSMNAPKASSKYVTKAQAIELGDKLFG